MTIAKAMLMVALLSLGFAGFAEPKVDLRIDALFDEIASDVREAPLISVPALAAQLKHIPLPADFILLDERDSEERAVSGIPGAIEPDALPGAIATAKRTLGAVPIHIAVYCTIGYRSGKRVIALNRADSQVRAVNLRGGILAWVAGGGVLVTPNGKPTKAVHVYAKRWAVVPTDFKAQY
jgi:rhodanese-related sulfurtransferase